MRVVRTRQELRLALGEGRRGLVATMGAFHDGHLSLMRAARDANVKLMVAYRLHFDRANLEAAEVARSGRIGDPRLFNSTFSTPVVPGNIRVRRDTGGGVLYDIGIYCINAARTLFGDERQKREWLPPLASGEKLAAFGLTDGPYSLSDAGFDGRPLACGDHERHRIERPRAIAALGIGVDVVGNAVLDDESAGEIDVATRSFGARRIDALDQAAPVRSNFAVRRDQFVVSLVVRPIGAERRKT